MAAKHRKKSVTVRPNVHFASGNCSYAGTLRLGVTGTWKVTARFEGNASLLAGTAAARSFRAG